MWWWRWRKRSIQDLFLGILFQRFVASKGRIQKNFQKYPGEVCRKNFLQEKKEFVETSAEVFVKLGEFRTEKLNDRIVHIGNDSLLTLCPFTFLEILL